LPISSPCSLYTKEEGKRKKGGGEGKGKRKKEKEEERRNKRLDRASYILPFKRLTYSSPNIREGGKEGEKRVAKSPFEHREA